MKYFIVLAAFLVLGSCQQSSSKKSTPATSPTPPNQQGVPPIQPGPDPQPQPQPAPTPDPAPVPIALPVLSFGYDQYVYDGENEIHIELLLSQPSEVPVTVDVALLDGTAIYHRDYSGFMAGGNDLKLSVVFAPNQTRIDLPHIYIQNQAKCNSVFTAQLTGAQHAVVNKDTTQIFLGCF